MARVRLIWQLFPAFILILLASLLAMTWVVTGLVAGFHEREARSSLEDRLSLMRLPIGEALRQGGAALADARCKALARQAFTRFTLIGRDGVVLADSAESPAAMENHGHRPEVRTALAGGIGSILVFVLALLLGWLLVPRRAHAPAKSSGAPKC